MKLGIIKPLFSLLAAMLFLAVPVGAGCGKPAPFTVRIGYLLGDLHQLPFFVANDRGFFADEGITVQVVGPFDAGPAEMDALAANQLDMGYVGVAPAVLAAARKVNLSLIAGVNLEGSALVSSPVVTGVESLKGRKVATPSAGSIQYLMMGMLLEKNSMSYKDLELLAGTVKPPDMPASLQTGNIDGYFVWEPYVAKSVTGGYGKVLVESGEIWPGHPCCVVTVRNDFAQNNEKSVAAVIRAHQRAVRFIADNPVDTAAIAAKWTKLDAVVISNAMHRVKYTYALSKEDVKKFAREIIRLSESGAIKPIFTTKDVPDLDAFVEGIVNLKFIQG